MSYFKPRSLIVSNAEDSWDFIAVFHPSALSCFIYRLQRTQNFSSCFSLQCFHVYVYIWQYFQIYLGQDIIDLFTWCIVCSIQKCYRKHFKRNEFPFKESKFIFKTTFSTENGSIYIYYSNKYNRINYRIRNCFSRFLSSL